MAYTYDITITSHTSMCAAKKYIQPYLYKVNPLQYKYYLDVYMQN